MDFTALAFIIGGAVSNYLWFTKKISSKMSMILTVIFAALLFLRYRSKNS
jgi:DMSO/TMAO reductase YedYZ heme-binding membrane subunit